MKYRCMKMEQCDHCAASPLSATTTTRGSQELLDCASRHSSFFSSYSQSLPRISSRSPYSIISRYLATSSFSMKIYSLRFSSCVRDRMSAEDYTYTQNRKDFAVRYDFISSDSDSMAGSSFRNDTSCAACFSTTIGSSRLQAAFSLFFRSETGAGWGCSGGMEWVEGPRASAGSGLGSTFSETPLAERVLFFSKRMMVRFFSSLGWGRLVASARSCSAMRCSDLDFRLASGCAAGEGSLCSLMESSEGSWFSFYSCGVERWAAGGTRGSQ